MRGSTLRLVLACVVACPGCTASLRGFDQPKAAPPPKVAPTRELLDGPEFARRRVRLAIPDAVLTHQVALTTRHRSNVVIGRLRFRSHNRYHLEAQLPFGLRLFAVGYNGRKHYGRLRSRFARRVPLQQLARDVGRVYFASCPPAAAPRHDGKHYVLSCRLADGSELREELDPTSLAIRRRLLRDAATGRLAQIVYSDYGWYGRAWHPRRIVLELGQGQARIEILLVRLELPDP